jgi:hypothetical protein
MKTLILIFAIGLFTAAAAAQEHPVISDSSMVFGIPGRSTSDSPHTTPLNSWGVGLMISTNGFGMGTFYRHEYSDDVSGFIDLSVSEAKDDDEREYVDYYGQTYIPGKINRFLVLPLFVGIEKRLFKDDIMDNFRPYITAAAGPAMIYVFPYNDEYFTALGEGHPKYTAGGFIGAGAYFGSERSNLLGINIRYYYIPYNSGIESMSNGALKTQFGGVSIILNFGTAW